MITTSNLVAGLRRVLLLNCHDASRLQSEALDRPLSVSERSGLRLHLLCCRLCRRYGRQLQLLRWAVGDQKNSGSPPDLLSAQARERIKQALAKEWR